MDFGTDVFAVGVVLFELLTGRHPFEADTIEGAIEKIRQGDAQKLPTWVPFDLNQLISKMINSDYIKRPTTLDIMKNQTVKASIQQYYEKEKSKEEKREKEQQAIVLTALKPSDKICIDRRSTIDYQRNEKQS
ncbi:MAG: hypothetical protein EZS28_035137 [Streblomastix strix]|uniref:Protein kinase domain-containing protein n=1 Tax=Streblomastix strix TaxID=222440 RepID=A0A5J4UEY9_9EUKA|nr:MAG: hypothetical protein EZS28_035137 [Streblomastix strix]